MSAFRCVAKIGIVNVLINQALDGGAACYVAYSNPSQILFLVNDAGPATGLSPALVLGGTGSVSNSQCTIYAAGSSAITNGNRLTLTLDVTFRPSFTDSKVIYAAVRDLQERTSGWQAIGFQEVSPAVTFPRSLSMTPSTGTTAAATVSIAVTAVNDAPSASAQSVTTAEDTAKAITLAGTDAEGSALTFAIVANPTNGTLTGSGTSRTYTPAANYSGSDSFTFKVNDGTSDSLLPATVSITVNAAPVPTATATPGGPTATPTPPPGPTATATPTVVPTGPTPVPTPAGSVCGDAPRSGCRAPIQPRGALLTIKKGTTAAKDKLLWKWAKGPLTPKSDFGLPASTTDYELCIYDGTDSLLVSARAPKGDTCRTNELRDCWKENSKGYRYVDRDLTPDGLQQVQLKSGTTGKAQIIVKGRGNNLHAPALSVMNLPVRVQVVNGGGACWEATYSSTFQNTATSFKAKSD